MSVEMTYCVSNLFIFIYSLFIFAAAFIIVKLISEK